MGVYEASFLGEPQPIREKKSKKKNTQAAPEPVAVEVAPAEPKPKAVRKRKEPEPVAPIVLPVPVKRKVKVVKELKHSDDEEMLAPLPIPPKTKKAARAANKKVIVAGVEAEEAPAWFKAHMHAEAKRRNEKKPKAEKISAPVLKIQTEVATADKWNDEATKSKINKVESQMDRLYRQIHGK